VCEIRLCLAQRLFSAPLLGQGGGHREREDEEGNAGNRQR